MSAPYRDNEDALEARVSSLGRATRHAAEKHAAAATALGRVRRQIWSRRGTTLMLVVGGVGALSLVGGMALVLLASSRRLPVDEIAISLLQAAPLAMAFGMIGLHRRTRSVLFTSAAAVQVLTAVAIRTLLSGASWSYCSFVPREPIGFPTAIGCIALILSVDMLMGAALLKNRRGLSACARATGALLIVAAAVPVVAVAAALGLRADTLASVLFLCGGVLKVLAHLLLAGSFVVLLVRGTRVNSGAEQPVIESDDLPR